MTFTLKQSPDSAKGRAAHFRDRFQIDLKGRWDKQLTT
jgi:hypothetical protein